MAVIGAQEIIAGLVARGVPQHVAEGVVMNFRDESGLDTGIQEHAPISGRGGFGLAQWTGPRRVALEDFARSQGKPIDDPNVQLDFFMMENQGAEAPAWKTVMSAPSAQDAAVAFVKNWERPTSENVANRTAQYMGAGDSPSEGGARFGGTGLEGAQPGSTAPLVAGAAPASPYALQKTATADKYQKAAGGVFKGLGDLKPAQLGADGNAPQLPQAPAYAMESAPIVAGGGAGADPAMLQALLARLNKNTLWG